MSGTACKTAAVQLMPLIDYKLLELRCFTTGTLVLPSFPAVLLNRSAVAHVDVGWLSMTFDLGVHFLRNGAVVCDTSIYKFPSKMFPTKAT